METRTIALVNHQPVMLDGLTRIFSGKCGFAVVAKSTSTSAVENIALRYRPDLFVIDPAGSEGAVKAIASIVCACEKTKVVAYSGAGDVDIAVRALDSGAAGFVCTSSTVAELMDAMDQIVRGEVFISPNIATKVIAALRMAALRKAAVQSSRLSVREDQVVRLLLKGKTNREIADDLGLSEKTVKHYMSLLMQKLEAKNRLELALSLRSAEQGPLQASRFN